MGENGLSKPNKNFYRFKINELRDHISFVMNILDSRHDTTAAPVMDNSQLEKGSLPSMQTQEPAFQKGEDILCNSCHSSGEKSKGSEGKGTHTLDFSSLGLQGRDEECKVLSDCYRRATTSRQLVCIGGPSGMGKSSLTDYLKTSVIDMETKFLFGKYNLTESEEPYSAFVEICKEISCTDLGSDSLPLDSFRCTYGREGLADELRERLGTLVRILCRVVPCLKPILIDQETEHDHTSQDTETGLHLDERHQLHIAFRVFFRVLCEVTPHVLVLDDLHWADQASIDLLRFLITDIENPSLMIVACFRDDKVYDLKPFGMSLNGFKEVSEEGSYGFTQITIGNLGVSAINSIIKGVLNDGLASNADILALSKVVHSRTQGNPFFSLQFIKSLTETNLLNFDKEKGSFVWDLARIESETVWTSDIVEFMQAQLKRLPPKVKVAVHLASSIGTVVPVHLFRLIMRDFESNQDFYLKALKVNISPSEDNEDLQNAEEILTRFVEEGLMNRIGKGKMKWEHDKILEAAMISKPRIKAKVHLRVGEILLEKLSEDELDDNLFVVVRLFNDGSSRIPTTQIDKRVLLAELNLKAGKRSLNNAGFQMSRGYFTKGIELLPSNHGRVYSDLSVDLFSSAAEAEYCVGDFVGMANHCRDIICRPSIPLVEKKRAYKTFMAGLNSQGKAPEAFALGLELLEQLDCHIPKRGFAVRIFTGLNYTKKIGKEGLDSVLDSVPPNNDPDKLWALDLLADMFLTAYLGDMPFQMALTAFKSFKWTVKYGRNHQTPLFLAQVAIVAICMGEYSIGAIYADQAMSELDKHTDERLICDVIMQTFTLAWHWSHLIDAERLVRGYIAGIKVGSVENASWNINNNLEHRYFTGASLESLLLDSIKYAHQMKEFDVLLPYNCTLFIIQSLKNLMESSTYPARLTGDIMNEDKKVQEYLDTSNALCTSMLRQYQFILAFLFDDFDRVFQLRSQLNEKQIEEATPALFGLCMISYGNAMCGISLYRKTGKRTYLRTAKQLVGKLKGWANAGVSSQILFHSKLSYFLLRSFRIRISHNLLLYWKQNFPKSQANQSRRRVRCTRKLPENVSRLDDSVIKPRRSSAGLNSSSAITLTGTLRLSICKRQSACLTSGGPRL